MRIKTDRELITITWPKLSRIQTAIIHKVLHIPHSLLVVHLFIHSMWANMTMLCYWKLSALFTTWHSAEFHRLCRKMRKHICNFYFCHFLTPSNFHNHQQNNKRKPLSQWWFISLIRLQPLTLIQRIQKKKKKKNLRGARTWQCLWLALFSWSFTEIVIK